MQAPHLNGGVNCVNCHDVAEVLLGPPIHIEGSVWRYGSLVVNEDSWIDYVAGTKGSNAASLVSHKTGWSGPTAEGWIAKEFVEKPTSNGVAQKIPTEHPAAKTIADDIAAHLARFVVLPSKHALWATSLWVIHAHLMGAWENTPRIAFLSAEWGSGKSRALEVIRDLVPNPVWAVDVTSNYLIRKIGQGNDNGELPTVLYDEIDTVFGPKADKNYEDIRRLLNAGYRRGAMAGRCVMKGKNIEPEDFPAFGAVALAGIGNLPDTITSRSINIRMKRRTSKESIEPYRQRINSPEGHALRDRITQWASDAIKHLGVQWPKLPLGVEDRQADVWESLIAVADVVGGEWPDRARKAAVAFVTQFCGKAESDGVRLLGDVRTVFESVRFKTADDITTKDLLEALYAIPEAPWKDWGSRRSR